MEHLEDGIGWGWGGGEGGGNVAIEDEAKSVVKRSKGRDGVDKGTGPTSRESRISGSGDGRRVLVGIGVWD